MGMTAEQVKGECDDHQLQKPSDRYFVRDSDAMEGEEDEDSNALLIKMLAKAQGPEIISAFPGQRKQSNVSVEEKATRKDSQQANPLYT